MAVQCQPADTARPQLKLAAAGMLHLEDHLVFILLQPKLLNCFLQLGLLCRQMTVQPVHAAVDQRAQ